MPFYLDFFFFRYLPFLFFCGFLVTDFRKGNFPSQMKMFFRSMSPECQFVAAQFHSFVMCFYFGLFYLLPTFYVTFTFAEEVFSNRRREVSPKSAYEVGNSRFSAFYYALFTFRSLNCSIIHLFTSTNNLEYTTVFSTFVEFYIFQSISI